MERIKSLGRYQKGVILFMIAMILAFTVMYPMTISRVGFAYMDAILVPSQENGGTVYTGKILWQRARFTVSADKTVVFQHGDKIYGPYTAKEDPSAIPKDEDLAEDMTGVELRQGDEILFRGGVLKTNDFLVLYSEDGTPAHFYITYTTSDGIERDESGNPIDPVEPFATTILELMNGPQLTHKGQWPIWFLGVLCCGFNTFSILFADELFRFALALRVRCPDGAEPSELEIAGRYIGWTVLAVLAVALFVIGLRW